MKGKLDVAKMEAAFKRAADKAVHGTREERSGRFQPAKGDDAAPAGRLSKQSDASRRKT